MTVASCAIDFTPPIRSGTGSGVKDDGTVDACLVQRSYLRAWCRAHPDSPLTAVVGIDVPDDEPSISRVIRSFAIALNDGLPDDERQRLVAYEERILGTLTTDADEETRAWLATDWLVRRFTPAWLRKCGLGDRADELEALPALTSSELARQAQPIIDRAKSEAYAAWDAAGAAAGAAAWAAAGAAAGAAAWDAARAAAWDAARHEKGYDAQYAAARKAADAVVAEKLGETIVTLREEAFQLFDDMIAVGREAVPA